MSISITPQGRIIGFGIQTPFSAGGGTAPYTWSVAPNGVGGSINASTGLYTAPPLTNVLSNPRLRTDRIIVEDDDGDTAQVTVTVYTIMELVLDIVARQADMIGRAWLFDQKINQPNDTDYFLTLSELRKKHFGVSRQYSMSGTPSAFQAVNVSAAYQLDLYGKTNEVRNIADLIPLYLFSEYSIAQQEANNFSIARLGFDFQNLSGIDGAAIPYHYAYSFNVQYAAKSASSLISFYDDFEDETVIINS